MSGISQTRAMEMLAESIGEIVGKRSEVYRDMMRAFESDQVVDLLLAQSSFDALPGDVRQEIAQRVRDMVEQVDGDSEES